MTKQKDISNFNNEIHRTQNTELLIFIISIALQIKLFIKIEKDIIPHFLNREVFSTLCRDVHYILCGRVMI